MTRRQERQALPVDRTGMQTLDQARVGKSPNLRDPRFLVRCGIPVVYLPHSLFTIHMLVVFLIEVMLPLWGSALITWIARSSTATPYGGRCEMTNAQAAGKRKCSEFKLTSEEAVIFPNACLIAIVSSSITG